ncbi:hypothetical protein ACFSFZ_03210 [Mixta tenebrionis]|uniref:Uncharacterized protein n=1 Tax=Mixta tenebrionis TaxID=2562439 RepID=A0A506V4Y2_9GAMM|nr:MULTISPECIES: hypothetical protein [Mixta]QHM77554.1 hypothetical protein C7M52_03553 [Mixta theicola]TPW40715.1 hypothetical protein FKM52_17515 [Mixta tenebrionis]
MRTINTLEIEQVSGAGFSISTSDILNFFRPQKPATDWESNFTTNAESTGFGKGDLFGKIFVGLFAVAAVTVAVAGAIGSAGALAVGGAVFAAAK